MRSVGLRSGVRAGGPGVEREAGRTRSRESVQCHCLLESQTLLPLSSASGQPGDLAVGFVTGSFTKKAINLPEVAQWPATQAHPVGAS